jgi:hypothetical protein
MYGSRIHFTPDFTSPIVYQTSRWRLVVNLHNSEILSYNSQSNETRTYSFDVFDTFLLRACSTPNGVFERAFQFHPSPGCFLTPKPPMRSIVARRKPAHAGPRRRRRDRAKSRSPTSTAISRFDCSASIAKPCRTWWRRNSKPRSIFAAPTPKWSGNIRFCAKAARAPALSPTLTGIVSSSRRC